MKLAKAIEILTLDVEGSTKIDYNDWQTALKLGIEALKRYKVIRANFGKLREDKLPGETKEYPADPVNIQKITF